MRRMHYAGLNQSAPAPPKHPGAMGIVSIKECVVSVSQVCQFL